MDSQTTLQSLKDRVQAFCGERDWDQFHTAKDLSIGLITEASELLEHFRFKSEAEIDELLQDSESKGQISEELADVFFFVLRFSQKYKIDLTQTFLNKLQKNAEKYPVEKARGSNRKYDEF